jgi:hypothetical protein
MQRPVSPWVAVIVVLICIALVLLIYKFTVGTKVSREAPVENDPTNPPIDDPTLEDAQPGGPGGSHATPVTDDEVRTRPEEDKQPLPPGERARDGE